MPFQLDTSIYGGGGAPRQQRSGLGMLGELMDIKARKENMRGMQEQRDYINEQRQLAIEKAERDAAEAEAGRALGPNPTREQLIQTYGYDKGNTAFDRAIKESTAREVEHGKIRATAAQEIGELPEAERPAAWDRKQDYWIGRGMMPPEHRTVWSPEVKKAAIYGGMSAPEFAAAGNAATNAETNAAQERRAREKAEREKAGEVADTTMKVRANIVPQLQVAKNKAAYAHLYNQIGEEYRGTIPTPDEFAQNPAAARAALGQLGVSPEQYQAHKDRQAALAQAERHFNVTNTRLGAANGITPAMVQSAKVRKDDDILALQREKAQRLDQGTPMTEQEELRRTTQIEQNFLSQTGQPRDLGLAERLKEAALKDLEEKITRRSKDTTDTQGNKIPARPMADAVIKAEKLAIYNRYRADHGLGPVTTLPPEWTGGDATPKDTPQDGTLGALANTTPPKAQPTVRPQPAGAAPAPAGARPAPPALGRGQKPPAPGSPASQDPGAAARANALFKTITDTLALQQAGKPVDLQKQAADLALYKQLTGGK